MSTTDYIPPPKDLFFHPGPPPTQTSGPDQKWILEIGPGKGEFILNQAQENPNVYFVAIEVKRTRFEKISRRAEKLELNNLFLIRGDARECLPRLFAKGFFEKIYILFPDPFPKKRHAKHRLIKPRLINQLRDFLKPEGEIINATDAGFYSEQIIAAFEEVGGFLRRATPSPYPTYFEQKWKALGRSIDYWNFKKVS